MIDTYSRLVTALGAWNLRADQAVNIPVAIAMAEAHFNTVLRIPEMEERVSVDTDHKFLSMPPYSLQIRDIRVKRGNIVYPMEYVDHQYADKTYGDASGTPVAFSTYADQIVLFPTPDGTYGVEIDYYEEVPPLTGADPSNWMLRKYPNAYFYGVITEVLSVTGDPRAMEAKGRRDEVLDTIQREANKRNHSGAPIYARPI